MESEKTEHPPISRREEEVQFRLLAENVQDVAIFLMDVRGFITTWNSGAERMKGWSAEEAIGEHYRLLYLPEDVEAGCPERHLEQARETGKFEDKAWRQRKDGGRFWAHVILTALHDAEGELRGFAKITQDRSAEKRAVTELREADRRKDEFLAMLAHELRNPLGAIRNAVAVLEQAEPDSRPFVRNLEVVKRQLRHQSQIVDDLLDLSRLTRGKMELRSETLDLAQVVREAVEDFRRECEAKSIALSLQVTGEPFPVRGDATRLAQVLGNLLHNACKFTPDGERVEVAIVRDPTAQKAEVRVRDTGVGISADLVPHLFEAFSQGERTLDRSQGGLGLGLAIVRGLVEMHGGDVRATSDGEGLGAEFTFSLPLDTDVAIDRPAEGPRRGGTPPVRVLVIEDNRDAADALRDLLELAGYEAEVAYTGRAGLAAAGWFQPEVVLCDLGLPGLDGFGVAEQLRLNPTTAKARLVALTGYGRDEDRQRAEAAGFDLHLTKPADPQKLEEVLARFASERTKTTLKEM